MEPVVGAALLCLPLPLVQVFLGLFPGEFGAVGEMCQCRTSCLVQAHGCPWSNTALCEGCTVRGVWEL